MLILEYRTLFSPSVRLGKVSFSGLKSPEPSPDPEYPENTSGAPCSFATISSAVNAADTGKKNFFCDYNLVSFCCLNKRLVFELVFSSQTKFLKVLLVVYIVNSLKVSICEF